MIRIMAESGSKISDIYRDLNLANIQGLLGRFQAGLELGSSFEHSSGTCWNKQERHRYLCERPRLRTKDRNRRHEIGLGDIPQCDPANLPLPFREEH